VSGARRPPSLRTGIALAVAALSLLLIVGQAVALILMFEEKEEEFITDILDQQIQHSIAQYRASGRLLTPNTPDMRLYRLAAGEGVTEIPSHLAGLAVGDHEIFADGHEFHVAVREADAARFILAYDVEDHEARLRALTVITFSSALLMALVTLGAVYVISGRLTRRLSTLAAQAVSGGGRYAQPGMAREELALARALEILEERQRDLLARERAFTADLGHELRTPLAGIRSDAELIAAQPALPPAVLRRAGRIVDSVDRISGLASSLLILAREARVGPTEAVDLAGAVQTAWQPLADRAAARGVELACEVPPGRVLHCDPALLDLILRNLLDNAVRHSAPGRIVCRLEGACLSLRDNGPGIPEADLPRVFERFFRAGAAGGHGLGLALVRHACAAAGWRVCAGNAAEGGAVFRIDLADTPASG
jgi:signal transduction histidine kinase